MLRSSNHIIKIVAAGLFVGAIVKEWRTPSEDRDWHGDIARFVPYDFRFPSIARVQERWWNPDLDQIFTPNVFGVGWAINVGRIARLVGIA